MSKFTKYLAAFAAIFAAGMSWATPTAEQTEDSVASVGTNTAVSGYYADLQEAISALNKCKKTANYKLTLLKDVNLSKGVTSQGVTDSSLNNTQGSYFPNLPLTDDHKRSEVYLIDLNGKTITLDQDASDSTVTKQYAFEFLESQTQYYETIRIYNGSIIAKGGALGAVKDNAEFVRFVNVTMKSENATNPTCLIDTSNINGILKGCTIENTLAGGAITCKGREVFIHSSTVTCAGGKAIYVAQAGRLANGVYRGGFACSDSTVTGKDAIYVDKDANKVQAYITGGSISGNVTDKKHNLTACGGTFTKDPEVLFLDGYDKKTNEDGTYTIIEDQAVIVDGVESTIGEAFKLEGVKNRTIKLTGDIFLLAMEEEKHAIHVKEGQNITLDLNNHTINVFDVSCGFKDINCVRVEKGGTFNLTDLSEKKTGIMTFTAWVMDCRETPGWANNVMTITGTLNMDAGVVENRSIYVPTFSVASYCADIYPSYADNVLGGQLNISGGELRDTGIPVRMFNGPGREELNMTGGFLNGGLTAIWIHCTKDAQVRISGGKVYGLGTLACIYNEGDQAGCTSKVVISNNEETGAVPEIKGHLYTRSSSHSSYMVLNGGSYIGNYKIMGYNGTTDIQDGVYDPSYINNGVNLMKFYGNYVNYFGRLIESKGHELMIGEDGRYCFGAPTVEIRSPYCVKGTTIYIWDLEDPALFDRFSSLPLALSYLGKKQTFFYGNYDLVAQNVNVLTSNTNEEGASENVSSRTIENESVGLGFDEAIVDLNGHKLSYKCSSGPLATIADNASGSTLIKIVGAGSIKNDGVIFASKFGASSAIKIYGGDYDSESGELFSGNVKVVADVGDGSYFDVNPASFSHDVSQFVYNEAENITFKTINANDARYYLGRVVEVQDAPAK